MSLGIIEKIILQRIAFQSWPLNSFPLPHYQAHRGYHVNGAIENTTEAFRQARLHGAKMCECDVRLTKDQIPIVFHDHNLKRMAGDERQVGELNFSELKEIFLAPRLEDLLLDSQVPDFWNIELKSHIVSDPLARKVAEVIQRIQQKNSSKRVMISSFNPFALWLVQHYLPETPRALLVTHADEDANKWYLRTMALAPLIDIHMLNLDQDMLSQERLDYLRKNKIPFSVWTVNDPNKAIQLLQMGALSIISDKIIAD